MRLIDAEKLKKHIDKLPALPDGNFAGTHRNLKALINMQPTVVAELPKDMIRRQDVIDELMTWDGHCITDAEQWHLRQVIGSIKSIPGGENDT